jgi:serine/threonine protein kinase
VQEARAASALDHPNIGVIHGLEETPEGRLFIVMAYYDGETLAGRLRRGPIAESQAIDIGRQVALGLAEAHSKGMIHRDIKPGNIMLARRLFAEHSLASPAALALRRAGDNAGLTD